ncbi:MAG: hypothetical protein J6A69_03235 [Clostridia bacterium]|nr:hypothetical protein [Clostridia bacterium]
MICKKCNGEIDKKAVVCVHCGCKIKKPLLKKWWFWAVIVILVIAIANMGGGEKTETTSNQQDNQTVETVQETVTYETVELDVMFEDLKNNAMKAEKNYQNKNIEFTGKIKSFDSDGDYITVEPTNADEWNFDSAMCYMKNEEQKNYLIEKNVGDTVTIKGKVKTIGEIIGYSIDIAEVQ